MDQEDNNSEDEIMGEGQLENVRMSNFAYSQTKIADFLSFYFAMVGVISSLIASEMQNSHDVKDEHGNGNLETWIKVLWIITNVSTIPLMLSIVAKRLLFIRWMKTKKYLTELDNLYNTGIFKRMIFEILMCLVMPYPFFYDYTYKERANEWVEEIDFEWNDFLLCFCIMFRFIYLFRTLLSMSFYTEARAQRVCAIYGCDANYNFALKALMKENPYKVLTVSILTSLLAFSYLLRLFERKVDENFSNFTTAMWNMVITMTTIGYGDYYAKSHMGRVIAIIIAFWGVFYVSLFVVALNNMLIFSSPQSKAYMLLSRL